MRVETVAGVGQLPPYNAIVGEVLGLTLFQVRPALWEEQREITGAFRIE